MNIMFMGTPDIAARCLRPLAKEHNIVACVTQADKPKGRGHALAMPPVKELALEMGIDVLQPATFKDGAFLEQLDLYRPDVIVVVAYGRILPEYVLNYPKYGCINLHASLLPKYRGASPIQWCIVCGETESGLTTMLMDKGLDTGDILLTKAVDIPDDMTGGRLYERYCELGGPLLLETLDKIETIVPQKQEGESSYAPIITKEHCVLDYTKSPVELCNLIRGLNPLPCAKTTLNGKVLKVYSARPGSETGDPGKVLAVGQDYIAVGCNGGSIHFTEVQLEGKKRMDVKTFLLGNRVEPGTVL